MYAALNLSIKGSGSIASPGSEQPPLGDSVEKQSAGGTESLLMLISLQAISIVFRLGFNGDLEPIVPHGPVPA